ncbi:RNA-binding protein 42 [Linum perenne]
MSIPPPQSSTSSASQFTYSAPSTSSTQSNASYFPTPFHLQQPYVVAAPAVKVPPVVAPVYTAPVGPVYPVPQFQQAQQLFQRDAQTITPEALESVKAALLASSETEQKVEKKKKAIPRKAAGQTWVDPTLAEWPENDYRIFCGDLGNEVNDDVLSKAFSRFPSFNMARVVRDKRTGKTKGYGFVSFSNPSDLAAALKEMNGKYVGNRPIKLRKSNWKERIDYDSLGKHKVNYTMLASIMYRIRPFHTHAECFSFLFIRPFRTCRITIKRSPRFKRRVYCTSKHLYRAVVSLLRCNFNPLGIASNFCYIYHHQVYI